MSKRTFRKFAKVEAKRMVKRMQWKHDKDGRAIARLSPYVGLVTPSPGEDNLCGWMLAVEMEKKLAPGITDNIKPIASNVGCSSIDVAKQECGAAMIRVVFEDILNEEAKRARNSEKREADRHDGSA